MQNLIDVGTRILRELPMLIKNEHRNFALAQNGKFHRFLHQPILAFLKGYLPPKRLR